MGIVSKEVYEQVVKKEVDCILKIIGNVKFDSGSAKDYVLAKKDACDIVLKMLREREDS